MATQYTDFKKDKDTQNVLEDLNNGKRFPAGKNGAGITCSVPSNVQVTAELQHPHMQGHHGHGTLQDGNSHQNQHQMIEDERPGVHDRTRQDEQKVNTSFGIHDAREEEDKLAIASGNESNTSGQESDKYEGDFSFSTYSTTITLPEGSQDTDILSSSQSMPLQTVTDETRPCLASDFTWRQFSVWICSPSGKKVGEFSISNIDPACFQYALIENYAELKLKISSSKSLVDAQYDFQIEKECLKMLVQGRDEDDIEEIGIKLKKQLATLVKNMFQCEEVQIPQKYQEYVFPHLQGVRPLVARDVVLLHSGENAFKVVGKADCIRNATDSIIGIVKDAERVMKMKVQKGNNPDVVSKDIVFMNISSSYQIEIVQNSMQFPNVQLKYLPNGIEISGVKSEIEKVQKEIGLKLSQVQTAHTNIPLNIGNFIWNHKDYVQSSLKRKDIKCVWSQKQVNRDMLLTVEALTKDEADSCLTEIQTCVKMDNFTKITEKMNHFLENYKKKLALQAMDGMYMILMTDDIHEEFCRVKMMDEEPLENPSMEFQENDDMDTEERVTPNSLCGQFFSRFVKEKMITFAKKRDVKFFMNDKNEMVIQGKSSSVDKVKQQIKETLYELVSNEDNCKSSFNHTYFESKRKSMENTNRCLIRFKPFEKPEIIHAWLTEHYMNVTTVHVGPIEQANADIIICPVLNNLLPIGVGCNIFTAGNSEKVQALTIEYRQQNKSKLYDGHVAAVVASGRLHCQHLALAVWPLCSNKQNLNLKCTQIMAENVISLIMDTGSRTVAFPLFVQNTEIDLDFAYFFLDSFKNTIARSGLVPHHVQLHFYAESEITGNTFLEKSANIFPRRSAFEVDFNLAVEKKTWKKVGVPLPTLRLIEEVIRKITPQPLDVEIFKGSITDIDDKVDAIVNSTTHTLDLDKGFVSSLLLKNAGDSIQQECKTAYSKGIRFGGLAVTGSGRLKCRAIFHTALYKWITDGEVSTEMLKLVIRRCLHEAERRLYKSIAFPALGAGNLQYPTYMVAETMQETIREFSLEYQPVNLKKVFIVLYEGDNDVIEAFEKIQSSIISATKGMVSRKNLCELPPKFWMQVHKLFGIKIMLTDKKFYENLKVKEARLVLGLTKSNETAAPTPRWEEEDTCFTFNINTDGSNSAIKVVLKKTVDAILSMKHQVVDVFLLSNDSGIQKQIETIIKVVTEKASQILSTTTRAKRSATSQPVCYVKMIRMFMSSSEYRDLESRMKDKKQIEFSPWQVFEMDTKGIQHEFKIEVFGHKSSVRDTLQILKAHIEKSAMDEQPSTGQWYYCTLDHKRDFPIPPELNKQLNDAADKRMQITTGDLSDEKIMFDFDTMECHNSEGKVVYHLKYSEGKKSGTTSKQTRKDQNARSLPEKPNALPREVVRQVSEDGKAMMKQTEADNDEDMAIITCTTCEIKQEYMEKAKQMLSKFKSSKNISVHEVNGKLTINGSFDDVKEANRLLTSADLVKTLKVSPDKDEKYSTENYNMSADEYAGLVHLSNGETWFMSLKKHEWIDEKMKYSVKKKYIDEVRQCIKSKVDSMHIMGEAEILLYKEVLESDLYSVEQDLTKTESAACFFSYDKKRIKIKAENYERAQQIKYMVEVKLGLKKQTGGVRKGRRFASNDPDYSKQPTDNKKDGEDFSRTVLPGNKPYDTGRVSNQSDRAEFLTNEGLKVFVYRGDILNLPVDCIVNAANADLQHGGGVAFFIAQAAGYSLLDESNKYIQTHGPLDVGACCSTTAGNMTQYHCVIHTVGPRWHEYNQSEKRDCLKLLKMSILSAIDEAAEHKHSSIAIPSISSGIFAVPKEMCAQEYFKAVEEFSQKSFSRSSIKEVHFVDKDAGMCRIVENAFQQCLNQSGKTTGRTYNRSNSEKGPSNDDKLLPAGDNSDSLQPKKKGSRQDRNLSNQFVFNFDKIPVKLVKGDITDCKTDIIVCPQDEKLSSYGKIAKAILNKATVVYKDSNASYLNRMNLKIGDVFPLKAAESLYWKYVFHVVPPHWGIAWARDPKAFERKIEEVVFNLLLKSEEYYQIESVAIPLLGVSIDEKAYITPLPTCVRGLANGIMKYAKNGKKKIDVEVWGFDGGVMSTMREVFNEKTNTGQSLTTDNETNLNSSRYQKGKPAENLNTTQKGNTGSHYGAGGASYHTGDNDAKTEDLGKTLKVDTIKGETCCICIDNVTNPKRLPCGHIFCKDCIDLAFTHKKACPNCGRVYGKLTGNQPKGGKMTTYVDKYKDLAGYKGCGHIKINYNIPGGFQTEEHPNPNKFYEGITRPAYLPNNEKGKLVAKLLEQAFNQRLIFTIGQSRTSGHEGVVTWNDIHHKTRMEGGPDRFGYPDPTYLDRVLDELAAKGVTKDSLQDK